MPVVHFLSGGALSRVREAPKYLLRCFSSYPSRNLRYVGGSQCNMNALAIRRLPHGPTYGERGDIVLAAKFFEKANQDCCEVLILGNVGG